ncbi:MAG: hypothetical protein ACM3NT_09070 [Methylocystaceae bacterium]
MYKKLILGLGAIAIVCSLTMPVIDALPPNYNGSIIFTWTGAKNHAANIPATASRTLALASGALLLAVVLPDRQKKN